MTTIYTLKETLHDRIKILEAAIDQKECAGLNAMYDAGEAWDQGELQGRLEEARVIFKLVDQVARDQVTLAQEKRDHPLLYISADEIEREDMEEWGSQERGSWPHSTFGGSDFTEAEPGTDRNDPGRC